jgi:NhaA family Na+:H+ antiporter
MLPPAAVQRLLEPMARFLRVEALSGVILLAMAAAALVLANSSWADAFAAIWRIQVGVRIGGLDLSHTLRHWINEGLRRFPWRRPSAACWRRPASTSSSRPAGRANPAGAR